MQYIVADLEWNGAYSKKTHGYFNEIIEIGAVRLNGWMQPQDEFHAVIKPAVSKKLSDLVSDLTNITDEELSDGQTFTGAEKRFRRWIGSEEATLLTWSNTDLSVFLENYRYFLQQDRLPGFVAYADLQAYVQAHEQLGGHGQQVGLAKACEALDISDEGMEQHRALDDSRMTALLAQKTFEPEAFAPFVQPMDTRFYERLNFKPYYIKDIHSPLIPPKALRFSCPQCRRTMRPKGDWAVRNAAFYADMVCRHCRKEYTARAQFRKKYDHVEVKRKLLEPENPTAES